jgi:Kef-type K+ transport system membrane component KefB
LVIGFAFPDKGWSFALLLGAIATATAPASTMMTIRQYQAKGEFVNILLEVVSLDDAVCLICYTLAITDHQLHLKAAAA